MSRFLRPALRGAKPYVPGEQPPDEERFVKLNTNEYPEPPGEAVLAAARAALASSHRYPHPEGEPARSAAARAFRRAAAEVVPTNGSDEALRLIFQAFVAPGDAVAFAAPTYSYYETLAKAFGAKAVEVPREAVDRLPVEALAEVRAKVVFVASPDSPLGVAYDADDLARISENQDRLVVLDEAYAPFAGLRAGGDFGPELSYPNLIRVRSLSKGYALAGLRVGFALADVDLADDLRLVRDTYNLDRAAAAAAAAALADEEGLARRVETIRAERARLAAALTGRGWFVYPSEANFLFACPPGAERTPPVATTKGREAYEFLKSRGVLVRRFEDPNLPDGVRITIGRRKENDRLIEVIDG